MSTIRPLTIDDLNLPDDELGRLFLDICISAEAENQGFPTDPVPEGFSRRIIALYREIEAEHAKHMTVEKVLRKCADEEFWTAGRLLKEHTGDGARNIANANLLAQQVQKQLRGPRAGGAKTKTNIRNKNFNRNEQIRSDKERLLESGYNPRSVAGTLAIQFGLSSKQIRRIIEKK